MKKPFDLKDENSVNSTPTCTHNYIDLSLNSIDVKKCLLHFIGISLGIFYFIYVRNLFENVTRYSHLTDIEREVSLPPAIAFRYGYYKRIAKSEFFLESLRGIVRDEDVSFQGNFNRFRQFSLTPEIVEGGIFHLFKRFGRWTGAKDKCEKGHGSISIAADGVKEENDNTCSISTSGNILLFYFNFTWIMESVGVTILFYFGYMLSDSIWCGITSCLLFIVSHPQRTSTDWLFPSQIKLEWIAFLVQTYIVSDVALRKPHPSWTSTVQIGVSTMMLILIGNQTEAQWLLLCQLAIITFMHILNVVNNHATSLVIFSQITGWQYASLVWLDPKFTYWSYYFYTFLTSIITVYLLQPVVDWVLLKTRLTTPKWVFFRKVSLILAFISIFFVVCKESRRVFGLSEDPRLSFAFQTNTSHLEFDSSNNPTSKPVSKNYDESVGKLEDFEEVRHSSSAGNTTLDSIINIRNILQICSGNRVKLIPLKFISKYGFQATAVIYVLSVCVLLPVRTLRARRTTVAQSREKRRRASNVPTSSKLNQLYAAIQSQNALIIFNLFLTLTYALYTMFLEGRWELLFTSHISLMLSLLCNQKRVLLVYRKRLSNRVGNGAMMHWGIVLITFCVIFSMGKLHYDQMYQNSRGCFQIENQMRKHFAQSLTWINENTEKSSTTFVGLDIPLVYVRLTTGRSCVTMRQRHDIHFTMEEEDETQQVKTKLGLTSSSMLSWLEIQQRIHSLYSRRKSISEYYEGLRALNITHLFLNRDACSTSSNMLQSFKESQITSRLMPSFYDFIWQWKEVSPVTSHLRNEKEVSTNSFESSCDLSGLFDWAEGNIPHTATNTASDNVINVHETSSASVRKGKGKNKLKKEGLNQGRKEDGELELDVVCERLLNERNVKPFTKVFENPDYTIFGLTERHPRLRQKNTNQGMRAKMAQSF